jgi:hypothetical protein
MAASENENVNDISPLPFGETSSQILKLKDEWTFDQFGLLVCDFHSFV